MRMRFVVLRHEGVPEPHFDLMIEAQPGGALMTWRLPDWPAGDSARAVRLPDHRRAYLDYEGEISGHRGCVKRVARGLCELTRQADGALLAVADGWTVNLPEK